MAKGKAGAAKFTKTTSNTEYHGRGPGPKGNGSPTAGGAHKKGDSRSKSMLKGISPQKGI